MSGSSTADLQHASALKTSQGRSNGGHAHRDGDVWSDQFILFSDLAPYVTQRFAYNPGQFSAMLLAYGAMGFVGNALLPRHIERVGASRGVFMALLSIAAGMLLTPWTTHWIAMGLALLPWGLGVYDCNSAQQAPWSTRPPGRPRLQSP